jgi:hypothetical protein
VIAAFALYPTALLEFAAYALNRLHRHVTKGDRPVCTR